MIKILSVIVFIFLQVLDVIRERTSFEHWTCNLYFFLGVAAFVQCKFCQLLLGGNGTEL